MKTIHISSQKQSVQEILNFARDDSLLIKTEDGDFIISKADEFDTEVSFYGKIINFSRCRMNLNKNKIRFL